ncbi:RHS repeat domain-containing protein, partial [Acinetobacter baumannii]
SVSHYDQAGRLIETIDANGNKVDYTYDAANRLLSRTIDPNGLNLVTRYQYDAKGERVSTTDANGVVTQVAYDLKGQVVSQTVDPTGLNLTT